MTDRHYPWDILGIDKTDDKKTIKKAYAVLIKQYKPDEYPEKFKEIQAAYKIALSMRQWQVEEPELSNTPEPIANKLNTEEFKLSETPVDKKEHEFNQQQNALIENLHKQLHEITFSPLAYKNKLENWKFIEDYYEIDDFTLKAEVAKSIFKKVAEYNLFQLQRNNTLLLNQNILKYLDGVFDWNSNWNEYQHIFPEHYFKATIDKFNQKTISVSRSNSIRLVLRRIISFVTEIVLYVVVVYFVFQLFSSSENFSLKLIGFIFYMMLNEAFIDNRTSFGKDLFNLIVLDQYGNVCSIKQSIARNLIFFLIVVIPLYIWLKLNILHMNIFIIYFSIVCSIYTIVFLVTKNLLHDFLTKTIVVRK